MCRFRVSSIKKHQYFDLVIMTEKFNGQYRIKSARLQNWDYANSGMYFITICTADRQHYFGEVVEGEMQLSEIGMIAKEEWL